MNDVKVEVYKQKDKNVHNYKYYGFDKMPYIDDRYKDQWFKLVLAQERVKDALRNYSDFGYVTFADVNAGGIQMMVANKKCHLCMAESLIKYDFSNLDEAIDEAIKMFEDSDNIESVKKTNDFYTNCMKYGWD